MYTKSLTLCPACGQKTAWFIGGTSNHRVHTALGFSRRLSALDSTQCGTLNEKGT
jgi:hypothetical protein